MNIDIFERLQYGEAVRFNDPQYPKIFEIASRTMKLSAELNASVNIDHMRQLTSDITEAQVDASTTVLVPSHINLRIFTRIGKNVFINHDCTFLDVGGITIEDDVLIGPKANLISESHPLNPVERKVLWVKPVVIKQNVWIWAGATILPGVTICLVICPIHQ